jgi:glyoxylase-like metal-dependent hydrolase (beta-lactamase superfamily II)
VITIKLIKKEFYIYQNKKLISRFRDELKVNKENFFAFKVLPSVNTLQKSYFEPPVFGITTLGNSHGFDTRGSTSGFIIWVNKRGIMIDPPPYSSQTLRLQGISPMLIEKVIITHCHADHDSGAFHKILESHPIELLSTETIVMSFLRKYSAIADISIFEISKLVKFRTVYVGHPVNIFGAKFHFYYTFHSIPAICFEVHFQDKKIFFSGDTFYNPPKLKEIYEQKDVFSRKRYEELALRDFSKFDIILHESGIPPIHTPQSVFLEWPPELLKKLYLFHCSCDSIKCNKKLKVIHSGLENSLVLLSGKPDKPLTTLSPNILQNVANPAQHLSFSGVEEPDSKENGIANISSKFNHLDANVLSVKSKKVQQKCCGKECDPFKTNLQLLAGVDIVSWIPIKRMLDLLEVIETVNYTAESMVIKANSYGSRFYFVKCGRLRIFSANGQNSFEKIISTGDYFGESAIFGDGFRLANVQAETDVTLLELEKFDFLWVFSNNSMITSDRSNEGLAPEIQLIKNLSDLRKAKLAEFINENIFVRGLNENQKCRINMLIREKKTRTGEILWKKNDKCKFCFFVREGKYQVKNFIKDFSLIG